MDTLLQMMLILTNIQRLEIRDQNNANVFLNAGDDETPGTADDVWGDSWAATNIMVDIDAFDDKLTEVYMRDEDGGATTFDLNDVTKDLAENGLVLAHSTSATPGIGQTGNPVVDVELNDATGDNDTVALTIVNDKNQGNQFNYSH